MSAVRLGEVYERDHSLTRPVRNRASGNLQELRRVAGIDIALVDCQPGPDWGR
jgi:hypothetical protein